MHDCDNGLCEVCNPSKPLPEEYDESDYLELLHFHYDPTYVRKVRK